MKKIIGLLLILALMVCALSIHVLAASQDMPAFYIEADTGNPVEIADAYVDDFSPGYYYPDCMQVTNIKEIDDDMVLVRVQPYPLRGYGGAYEFLSYVGDWCVSDLAAVVMYDNKTANIIDDSVVSAKYIGYVGGTWG